MNLTPIRIRGKKRNREVVRSVTSKISAPPLKRSKPSTTAASQYLKSRKTVMAASPTLQGLPQELLEIIFLHSMNISLPRASHILGAKLSSKAICLDFCMRTFFDTVDHRAPIRDRKITSDPKIQSELLTCRFFTYSFFLAYVQKAHDALVRQRGKPWKETSVSVPGAEAFDGLWPFKFTKIKYLGFAEGFRIPEKLLHGPFTEDKGNLLYVLVSLSGSIDWQGSMAGEVAKDGLGEAIGEGNERAVAGLSVLLGIAGSISTEHLSSAVREHGFSLNIIRHLLFNAQILYDSSTSNLDFYAPMLWRWADRLQEEEDERGTILKSMLKRASKFDLEFYREGETDWQSIVPFPYSGEKFDARSQFDRISRELLTRLYRNHGRKITRVSREAEVEPDAGAAAET